MFVAADAFVVAIQGIACVCGNNITMITGHGFQGVIVLI